jgi:hypothetical protein
MVCGLWQRGLDLPAAWRDKKLAKNRDGTVNQLDFSAINFGFAYPHVSSLKIFAMAWAPK